MTTVTRRILSKMRMCKFYNKLQKKEMKLQGMLMHSLSMPQARLMEHGCSSHSSSSSATDDEAIIDGLSRIHIDKNRNEDPLVVFEDTFGDICNQKLKNKKNKLKRKYKYGKRKPAKSNKLCIGASAPLSMIYSLFRDHSYDREIFSLALPVITTRAEECGNGNGADTQDPVHYQAPELGISNTSISVDHCQTLIDNADQIMQNIAKQVKKLLVPQMTPEYKSKVLELINLYTQPSTSAGLVRTEGKWES